MNEDLAINLFITEEGLSALLDAQQGVTNAVRIAELGITAQAFVPGPTIEDLPGELKRISMIAGEAVSDRVIHLVAMDDTADAYTVRGLALYLDGGALFAVYGQADPIFQKSSISSFLLAADITFAQAVAELIEFGSTNFLYPPATATRKGVAYLASAAEVADGTVPDKIVSPFAMAGLFVRTSEKGAAGGVATLDAGGRVPPSQMPPIDSIDTFDANSQAAMLALPAGPGDFCRRLDLSKNFQLKAAPATLLSNWVEFLDPGAPVRSVNNKIGDVVLVAADVGAPPTSRAIAVAGLAQGGGNFGADRTITVPKATSAEALAGLLDDRAVTPAALAGILAVLAAAAPAARQVLTAGLAQGGGPLTADRIVTVLAAAAADIQAGTRTDCATTPAALFEFANALGTNAFRHPGGLIEQWGTLFVPGSSSSAPPPVAVSFPAAFPVLCYGVSITPLGNTNSGDESDEDIWVGPSIGPGSFTLNFRGDRAGASYFWRALGK